MIEKLLPEGIAIMMRQRLTRLATYGVLLLGMLGLPWHASTSAATIIGTPVALSTLLVPNATITAGDKVFSGFSYLFTGDMPPANVVNVVPITDSAGNFGIEFQGAFIDVPSSPGGSDALIRYTVTVNDNIHLISDAHLEGNPTLLGTQGSMSVTETFLPLGANGQFTMKIYDDESVRPPKLVDNTVFTTPMKSLQVQKDILALAPTGSATQTSTISFVDQTYSQIVIPEPAAAMLMLGGVFGLGALRRRTAIR